MISIDLSEASPQELNAFTALPEYKALESILANKGRQLGVSYSIKRQGTPVAYLGFRPRSTGAAEHILAAAVGEHGDNAVTYCSNLVAAFFDGEESDHYQATQEVRRLLNVSERP